MSGRGLSHDTGFVGWCEESGFVGVGGAGSLGSSDRVLFFARPIDEDFTRQHTITGHDMDETPDADGPAWAGTPSWSGDAAAGLTRTAETVAPIIYPPSERVGNDFHLWDTWLLRERDGSIATPGGYRVVFALTAPDDLLPGKRHDVAEIRCLYSADGREWHDAGPVFADTTPLGSRQWAGSALYDTSGSSESFESESDTGTRAAIDDDGRESERDVCPGDLYVYYTAAGEADEAELTYSQRIAAASGGQLVVDDDGLSVEGPWTHEVLLEPDGEWYETEAQSRGMIYTFRDPWFFEDPATGETHLLFEANVPVAPGSDYCEGDSEAQSFNGCVGVATASDGGPLSFELDPPLLESVCVNQELERPHVIVRDGSYYLFVSSHRHTFAPGYEGFDALYGFRADELRGDYQPLNGTGLVLTNPANAPYQAYSWMAYAHEEAVLVTSFFNYYDLGGLSLDDVADLPRSEQFRRFGGTLAPTVRLAVAGEETRVVGTLDHGHLPLASEPLPSLRGGGAAARLGGYDRSAPTVFGGDANAMDSGGESGDRASTTTDGVGESTTTDGVGESTTTDSVGESTGSDGAQSSRVDLDTLRP